MKQVKMTCIYGIERDTSIEGNDQENEDCGFMFENVKRNPKETKKKDSVEMLIDGFCGER